MNKYLLTSAILLFVVISTLSLLPPESGVELPSNDKLSHFLAYSAFSLNVALLVFKRSHLILAYLFVFMYSILIEYLQGFVPGREPSGLDLIANLSGITLGAIIHRYAATYIRQWFP